MHFYLGVLIIQLLMQKRIYTRQVTLVKQELFILLENMSSLSVFSEIGVPKYIVFSVVVCLSLCSFFCWPLYCLSFLLPDYHFWQFQPFHRFVDASSIIKEKVGVINDHNCKLHIDFHLLTCNQPQHLVKLTLHVVILHFCMLNMIYLN